MPDTAPSFTSSALPVDLHQAQQILDEAVSGADDGELYIERTQSESLWFDDGRLKSSSFGADAGFGLRVVAGESVGYGNASNLSLEAIRRAAGAAVLAKQGYKGTLSERPASSPYALYAPVDPLDGPSFADKITLLQTIDAYARTRYSDVVQVSASVVAERREVDILRPGGLHLSDIRPLVRISIAVTVEREGRRETASQGAGGRTTFERFIQPEAWQAMVDEAVRQARTNLDAIEAPTGEMDVVLAAGWPGVLLHEAVGHGLEGDFNRKCTSAFAGRMGQRVAAPGVTVVDDGTLSERRGSLHFDDEGTPTHATTLIEDGILVGYMHDRQSARLMNLAETGNGRRQSYAHVPMPRMTNTFMLGGNTPQEEMIQSTKRGLFAVNFGGGQVDITNGKFVFQCTEAYLIEDGKITAPVKGATLIGDGPSALTRISHIGNDFALDPGVGMCGKAGQSLPVGIGQPSLKIGGLTVGGTAA